MPLLELLRALKIAHRILHDDVPSLSWRELERAIKDLHVDHPAACHRPIARFVREVAGAVHGSSGQGCLG